MIPASVCLKEISQICLKSKPQDKIQAWTDASLKSKFVQTFSLIALVYLELHTGLLGMEESFVICLSYLIYWSCFE